MTSEKESLPHYFLPSPAVRGNSCVSRLCVKIVLMFSWLRYNVFTVAEEIKSCIRPLKLQLTNVTNVDTVSSPKWPVKRSPYVIFFILTAGFRGHLCSLATLNIPRMASLINEKRNLSNLQKKEV